MVKYYCVVGTDGVGKSTLLDSLDSKKYHVRHAGNDFILHNIIKNKLQSKKSKHSKKNMRDFTTYKPGYKKKKSSLYHLLANCALWMEFSLTFLYREVLYGGKTTLVMDRSPFDLLVLNRRTPNKTLEKFLIAFLIKPQRVFILKDDYETIFKRKNQRTIQEMKEYYDRIEGILKRNNIKYTIVDVGGGIKKTQTLFKSLLQKENKKDTKKSKRGNKK